MQVSLLKNGSLVADRWVIDRRIGQGEIISAAAMLCKSWYGFHELLKLLRICVHHIVLFLQTQLCGMCPLAPISTKNRFLSCVHFDTIPAIFSDFLRTAFSPHCLSVKFCETWRPTGFVKFWKSFCARVCQKENEIDRVSGSFPDRTSSVSWLNLKFIKWKVFSNSFRAHKSSRQRLRSLAQSCMWIELRADILWSFQCVKCLTCILAGRYSDVFKAYDRKQRIDVAIKVSFCWLWKSTKSLYFQYTK